MSGRIATPLPPAPNPALNPPPAPSSPPPPLGLTAPGDSAVRGGSQLGLAAAALGKPGRVAVVARDEPLRTAVERLSVRGVRRLVVVQRGTGRVEGIVSLSDVWHLLAF
jgi:hypothetical protein